MRGTKSSNCHLVIYSASLTPYHTNTEAQIRVNKAWRHTLKDSESRELPESQRELSKLSMWSMSAPALSALIILASSPPPDMALGVSAGVLSRDTGVSKVGQLLTMSPSLGSAWGSGASDREGLLLTVTEPPRMAPIGDESSALSSLTLSMMAVTGCKSL